MKRVIIGWSLRVLALALCIVPALVAVIDQFPLMVDTPNGKLSVISAILIGLAIYPVKRFLGKYFQTPSVWMVWAIILIIFSSLGSIAEQIAAIALVATPTSALGSVLYNVSKRFLPPLRGEGKEE